MMSVLSTVGSVVSITTRRDIHSISPLSMYHHLASSPLCTCTVWVSDMSEKSCVVSTSVIIEILVAIAATTSNHTCDILIGRLCVVERNVSIMYVCIIICDCICINQPLGAFYHY